MPLKLVEVMPSLPSPELVARRTSGASRIRTTLVVGENFRREMVLRRVDWMDGREGVVRVKGSGFVPGREVAGRKREVRPSMYANFCF